MNYKQTFGNNIMIKLDPENDHIKTKSGFTLYIDTSFDPEKHQVVTGVVCGLPSRLTYTGKPNLGMEWLTDMEIREGDRVIVYYLSVVNALKKEHQRYFFKDDDKYVFVPYSKVFVVIRDGEIIPVNGYVLVEPCEDPFVGDTKKRLAKIGLELVTLNTKSNTNVSFGVVRYVGKPIREYIEDGYTDKGVDVKVGDTVVLRKVSDIPLQYNLHAKLDGGKTFWRVQRRKILAVV